MKKIDEKNGRITWHCDGCKKRIYYPVCVNCSLIEEEFRQIEVVKLSESKRKRRDRITKEFTLNFDKKILEFAVKVLEWNKKLLIKDLIDLFEQEGLFEGLGEVSFVSDVNGKKLYLDWAVKFTTKLAKVWHKRGDVYIGTRQVQGHPYEIYLPEDANKLIENQINIMSENPDLEAVVMPFGKHKGNSIGWIAENDKGYLVWLHDKCDLIPFIFK